VIKSFVMKPKVQIVYASLTGNTQEIADYLAACFAKSDVQIELNECQQVEAAEFLNADICVVCTYTYGSAGDLPDEIEDFFVDLGELNLKGKVYGVLGSGDSYYGYFCKSTEDFDIQFQTTGAIRGAEILKIESNPEEADKKLISSFADKLLKTWEKEILDRWKRNEK